MTSLKLARRLHNESPRIHVPNDLLAGLEAAGPEAARVGAARARRLLQTAHGYAAGVYVATWLKSPEEMLGLQ